MLVPSALSASIVPPCASVIARAMDSPYARPAGARRARLVRAVKPVKEPVNVLPCP